ncbi:MAG: RNA polymerase sigma factor [Thermaurantiacus sp.]
MIAGDARAAAEAAARSSYGRLLSLIAHSTRDIAAAEDALSHAFAEALRTWPINGVPDQPDAWLLTVARRAAGHARRHQGVRAAAMPALELMYDAMQSRTPPEFPDERLKLMFVCAHPAIDETIRTPLMLQTILGLDAARIARAFLVEAGAMSQRLVRAKSKIRDAGLAFEVPAPDEIGSRLADVLSAIYAAYSLGWDDLPGEEGAGEALTTEAIFLARLIVSLLPTEPEAKGLLSLMLASEARAGARRTPDGAYVPLSQQDVHRWDGAMIAEAEANLRAAAAIGHPGRFQTEAAIQSLHNHVRLTGEDAPGALLALYDLLVHQSPAIGAAVARAAAYGEHQGPEAGLACLDELPRRFAEGYQPYWAARLHLLRRAGRSVEAAEAAAKAITLTRDPAVAAWLKAQLGPMQ